MVAAWPEGLEWHPGYLDREGQQRLLKAVEAVVAAAPLYRPTMPKDGKPFSVAMTNAGPLGWVSDRGGYRYQAQHPETGRPWPAIPESILSLWGALSGYPAEPEACLINRYVESARMGLHRDADEAAKEAPVLSISLGDTAVFRIGSQTRRGPTRSFKLASGDVVVLGGASRHCFHGVDRILSGSSRLVPGGGRYNITLRRVTLPRV